MKRDHQSVMVRLVALPDRVMLSSKNCQNGRGGYLHPRTTCLEAFERRRVKEFRSLKRRIGSDERRVITELIRERLASRAGVE